MRSRKLNIQWPPIIQSHSVPLIIKLRDDLLTVVAWIILVSVLHDLWWLLYDYLSDPIFQLTRQQAPDWHEIWGKMSRFVYRAGIMVIWIIWFGSIRHALKKDAGPIAQPREINLEDLATLYGHSPSEVKNWQNSRSVEVYVNEKNGIETVVRNEHF
jgi:poly-beta-1,6-N-acetyl-D-glucosamine biosynthesis protein PgaD